MSEKEKKPETIEDCEKEKNEYLNNWKRERADFSNYKKEESERFKEIIGYNDESWILKLLPIIDYFEHASRKIDKEIRENDKFIKGLLQIKLSLSDLLNQEGVREIDCSGKIFDPHFHEAVEVVEKDGESGMIAEEVQKGYEKDGKLLRPAKVKIIK